MIMAIIHNNASSEITRQRTCSSCVEISNFISTNYLLFSFWLSLWCICFFFFLSYCFQISHLQNQLEVQFQGFASVRHCVRWLTIDASMKDTSKLKIHSDHFRLKHSILRLLQLFNARIVTITTCVCLFGLFPLNF